MGFLERQHCEICESKKYTTLIQLPFHLGSIADFLKKAYSQRVDLAMLSEHPYELLKCDNCHFIWQKYVLDSKGMHLLYDQWIQAEESLKKNQTHLSVYYKFLFKDVMFVSDLFCNFKPYQVTVLDFGMGWAGWARVASAFGFNCWGAELAKTRIDHAKSLGLKVIEDLDTCDLQFDYINSEQVLEHISDLNLVMGLISKKLKPGGIFRFSVPYYRKELRQLVKNKWQPQHDAFHPLEHVNAFSLKSISILAQKHHMQIASVGFFIRQIIKNPFNFIYILRRMVSHFYLNNVLLIKYSE